MMSRTVLKSQEESNSLALINQEKAKGLAWVTTDFFKRKTNRMLRHDEKIAEDINKEIEKSKKKLDNYFDEPETTETKSESSNTQTSSSIPPLQEPKPLTENKSENQDVNFI